MNLPAAGRSTSSATELVKSSVAGSTVANQAASMGTIRRSSLRTFRLNSPESSPERQSAAISLRTLSAVAACITTVIAGSL